MEIKAANGLYLSAAAELGLGVPGAAPSGYKLTEVGVIPEDWDVVHLAALTDPKRPISYGIVQTGPNVQNGIRCLRVLDLNKGRINKTNLITTAKEISEAYKRTILKVGDLVFPLRGNVGDVGLIDDELVGSNLTRGMALIAIRSEWSAPFCRQLISSSQTRTRLEQSMNGSALQEIPIAALRSFKIALPPSKAEQEAVAEALSDADALIEALEQLIAKKRQLKQAAMQELLTGKRRLPGFGQGRKSFRLTKLGMIPADWTLTSLERISAFITKGATPTTYGFSWENDGVIFLRSECVSEYGLDLSQSMFISEEAHQVLRRSEVRSGDLLITITGNVGRIIHLGNDFGDANINQHIARVRIIADLINTTFIFHFLSQPVVRKYFNQITTGQAYPQISLTQVREMELPMPTLAEQTAIAQILTDMDTEIAELETKLAKARAVKQGMMQQLLTGRIRLP